MKHVKACLAVASILSIAPAGAALAGPGPGGGLADQLAAWASSLIGDTSPTSNGLAPIQTAQPNASCEDVPNQPGNAITAPGSAFNPTGTAGGVYAGEQPQNSKNPKSVSQYDVACAQNQSHK